MEEEVFLVSGGIPRTFGEFVQGHVFKRAQLSKIDFKNKTYSPVYDHVTPSDFCSGALPSITFTGFCIYNNKIYIPTRTEVLVLSKKDYTLIEIITDPLFNDIHGVKIFNDNLYVVVTGLDAVFIYDLKTKKRTIINVLGKDPFHRFDKHKNLNKYSSLKPHESHPNNVFEMNNEIWVTRLIQKDAICLSKPKKKLSIDVGIPHDGIVKGDYVYFTTVNGFIVVFDVNTLQRIDVIKLSGSKPNANIPLGWCRGLYVGQNSFYVGFTQLRTTKFSGNLDWIRLSLGEKRFLEKPLPTRIEKYDFNGNYINTFVFPKSGIYGIFSIDKIE